MSFKYTTIGVVLVVVLVAAVAYLLQGTIGRTLDSEVALFSDISVHDAGADAFGQLQLENPIAQNGVSEIAIRPQSGGGGDMAATAGYGAASKLAVDGAILPAFTYTYEYVGDVLTFDEQIDNSVYKRLITNQSNNSFVGQLASANLGIVNLRTFEQPFLQQFTIAEQGDFGHIVSVDMVNQQVSLYERYESWEDPYRNCSSEQCYEELQLTPSDVPADDVLIQIAQDFLEQHNISTTAYGEPEVPHDWKLYQDNAVESRLYVPDAIPVLFPLQINGAAVRDESGRPYGMSVTINIRYQRVASVWNLTSQQYERATYELETQPERLILLAEQGNWRYAPYPIEGASETTVQLGTPSVILATVYVYSQGQSEQLFVPALQFPVVDVLGSQGGDQYMRTSNVVIPLVKQLLDQAAEVNQGGIMPLFEPVALPAR